MKRILEAKYFNQALLLLMLFLLLIMLMMNRFVYLEHIRIDRFTGHINYCQPDNSSGNSPTWKCE